MAVIKLENISYRYGENTPFEKTALRNVSLTFHENRVIGVIGHTGSGKSTLAQLLNGILKPSEGRILIDGKDIFCDKKTLARTRFRVGLVFQYPEYQLFEETVFKDIAFGPTNRGLDENRVKELVEQAALFTGLDPAILERSPFELSGGQKRRVALAGVMAMDPEVLVLDEPAAGLDPSGREEILGGLVTYQRRTKKTLILISHSMEDMARFADEIVVMKNGEIFLNDTTKAIFADPERITEGGLTLPQITRFARLASEKGLPIRTDLFTVEQARTAVLGAFREAGKC